jgi:6-pyruvoyltetrahydropterin/6-carboxytetrahydropterin synthase
VYSITKTFEFEAAHFLTLVPETHKCARMHGHNYVVVLTLSSDVLDDCGFVVDYGALKAFKEYLNATHDHRVLNDTMSSEPTAENLARELYEWCAWVWPQTTAVLVKETAGTSAEYRP